MNSYGINYDIAHKFDLSKLSVGDTFLGCIPCQKIYAINACGVPECGNCLGRLNRYTVTPQDFGSSRLKNEGDFDNEFNQAEEANA